MQTFAGSSKGIWHEIVIVSDVSVNWCIARSDAY